jgi:hypothetical protein
LATKPPTGLKVNSSHPGTGWQFIEPRGVEVAGFAKANFHESARRGVRARGGTTRSSRLQVY